MGTHIPYVYKTNWYKKKKKKNNGRDLIPKNSPPPITTPVFLTLNPPMPSNGLSVTKKLRNLLMVHKILKTKIR